MNNFTSSAGLLEFDDLAVAQEFFFLQEWTDGLPIVPPTPGKVRRFAQLAGRSPLDVAGRAPISNKPISVEMVAINAVMAGCLPEHFPVVLAAVEAIMEPEFNLHAICMSTDGATIFLIVNGPIAPAIGMNGGTAILGPGSRANAAIGRAVQLLVANAVGRMRQLRMATLGHAAMYTWCVAEAEQESPWKPFHVEHGFGTTESTVAAFSGLPPIQVRNHVQRDPADIIRSFGSGLLATCYGVFGAVTASRGLVAIVSPEIAGHFGAAGWSKKRVKDAIASIQHEEVSNWIKREESAGRKVSATSEPVSGAVRTAEDIFLIVGGGRAGSFCALVPLVEAQSGGKAIIKHIGGKNV
ncbi:MAG: hypothetical protein OXI87_09015 [Albidovulum sp.]|nr:hypothetical protein [Albidovulum sp.]MDE0305009.1 hypothetical protein [Albidovulum sp.]